MLGLGACRVSKGVGVRAGLGIQVLGFPRWDSRFRVKGWGFSVWGLGAREFFPGGPAVPSEACCKKERVFTVSLL